MVSSKGSLVDLIALVLVIIGAINWGLMGILEKDLIMGIIGLGWGIARVVYIVVGVAGIWSLITVLPRLGKS
ncbi:DUF378 domain-containing protein [Candidatus Fermentibacterales bacterium]|nr:DUF378 domain-containing protein [Candidatus Fermentibacterales bacterium]